MRHDKLNELRPILLVDDNQDDLLLLKRALLRAGLRNPVQSVPSGLQCVSYLIGKPPFMDRSRFPLPALLILDLKLPGTGGFEILRWISKQPGLVNLSVLVLSASSDPRDAELARGLGACAFVPKPSNLLKAPDLIASVKQLLNGDRPLAKLNAAHD